MEALGVRDPIPRESALARPRPRAFWADVRFLLGIALVVVSVVGVWLVVVAARQTAPVFATARTIVPGDVVAAEDLRVVEVALGHLEDAYASPATLQPGAVATRTIGEGQLVPRDALGEAAAVRTTTVVVRSATDLPVAVSTGASVDVWAAAPLERGEFEAPRILVASATVASVTPDDTMMGSSGPAVELVIERADVAATLAAIADGSSLSIVPATGATP